MVPSLEGQPALGPKSPRGNVMTEFTKTKIHFALALLGTLFAVHPYFEQWEHAGFEYLGFRLEILHAYALTGGLLALAVYFYAASLTTERGATGYERAANYLYATGLFVFPLYGLFYVSRLAKTIWNTRISWTHGFRRSV